MDSMDELRSPSLPPTSPAVPIIVFPLPSMLPVLQLLETIRCPEKPRAAHAADPRATRDDHGQAGELQRCKGRRDALGRASQAQGICMGRSMSRFEFSGSVPPVLL